MSAYSRSGADKEDYDYSCLKESDLYRVLRLRDIRRSPVSIDNPKERPCADAEKKIVKTYDGYSLIYGLATYGRKNNLTLEVHFITDKDKLYVILEEIHIS